MPYKVENSQNNLHDRIVDRIGREPTAYRTDKVATVNFRCTARLYTYCFYIPLGIVTGETTE
eukprot:3275496-Pyramimonas_sp.AAC.1